MKEVKVTLLRHYLSQYLARGQRGERLRVTSRGRVLAELVPASIAKGDAEAARMRLRGSVRRYDHPFAPVIDPSGWEANR